MKRLVNFGAGPGAIAAPILARAARELDPDDALSILEVSHRSAEFRERLRQTESNLRFLMAIPDDYKVLFLSGGASSQFAMVPLNLLRANGKADYVSTGVWSKKAISEARRFGNIRVAASSEDRLFSYIPRLSRADFDAESDFAHITANNTIAGTAFAAYPDTGEVPLVADMSSNILTEPIEVKRFGLIYAGSQKNLGTAGLTIVILRENLIGRALPHTPTMFDYKVHADSESLYNTPPVFAIYITGLVIEWIIEQGGLVVMADRNREKARILYDFLDRSVLFRGLADRDSRSNVNVTFRLEPESLEPAFLAQAEAAGLVGLAGHRLVGGLRASLYNAVTRENVIALTDLMASFEAQHVNEAGRVQR